MDGTHGCMYFYQQNSIKNNRKVKFSPWKKVRSAYVLLPQKENRLENI